MAKSSESRNSGHENSNRKEQGSSIGNRQNTTQTGAQNAGGESIDREEDQYTDDLRNSGQRTSSNRKNEESGGR